MKFGIIGMGLMGGSFARLLIKKGHTVFGADTNPACLQKAEMMSAISHKLTEQNAQELDYLIVALSPSQFTTAVRKYLPYLKSGATVIDFCGIKREIVKEMELLSAEYPKLNFIGGHPMAGREYSGIEYSSENLFEKASIIFVPVNGDVFAVDSAKKLFLSLGFGKVVFTSAEHHDKVIAYTSQLCHIVSNAFIKNANANNQSGYSAGSFRDLTRVARMNPDMWTELILLNSDNALRELTEFISNLTEYKKAIENKDAKMLKKLFNDGNERKIKIETENNDD